MTNRYDLLVVGAGVAGCMAARVGAERGLSVCIIDVKPRDRIGEKVCADAIGKHHFDRLGLAYPKGVELKARIKGVRVFSPSRRISYFVEGEGFIVNRKPFGQRLLKEALDAGAELLDKTKALGPIVKDGFVVGVEAKRPQVGKLEIYAEVTIDASGFLATIRSNMPPEAGFPSWIDRRDYCVGYREVRELKGGLEEPDVCHIYLSSILAPGGYAWVFPAGEGRANVGLGVQAVEGHPNPRALLYEHLLSWPMFKGSRVLEAGGWFIPTRRPLENMAWNGLLLAGDAACQANPLHGGGIGQSLLGGSLAAEVASDAIEAGDVSLKALWAYNVQFMRLMGARNAELDVFRIFLQKLTDDEIEYGMSKKLIGEEDLARVSEGESISLSALDKLSRALRALGRPGFLRRLSRTLKLMKEVRQHYEAYPASPDRFKSWEEKARALFEEARKL